MQSDDYSSSTKIEEVIELHKEQEPDKSSPVELKNAVHSLKRMSQQITQRQSFSEIMRMKTESPRHSKNKHSVKYEAINEDSLLSPVEELMNSKVEIQIDEHSEESKESVLSLTAIPKLKTEGDKKKISDWPELEESEDQKSDVDSDGSQQQTDEEEEVISNNSGESIGLSHRSKNKQNNDNNKSGSYQDSEEDKDDDDDDEDDD